MILFSLISANQLVWGVSIYKSQLGIMTEEKTWYCAHIHTHMHREGQRVRKIDIQRKRERQGQRVTEKETEKFKKINKFSWRETCDKIKMAWININA